MSTGPGGADGDDFELREGGAFAGPVVVLKRFSDLPNPRQRGEVKYSFHDVLLSFLPATVAGANSIVDIARFGQGTCDLLRRFQPVADGTASHHRPARCAFRPAEKDAE